MMLYDKYNIIANEKMGISYGEILNDPQKILCILLNKYRINELINIHNSIAQMAYDRVVHIINLFLTGELLFKELSSSFLDIGNIASIYEWELLSLVHDISYMYETKKFSKKHLTLNDTCTEMGLIPFFSEETKEAFYSPKTYENYFLYKREKYGVCDHGILAGIMFENRFPNTGNIDKLMLSYVIASHNIFVANRYNASLYREYNLFELIPDAPAFNCITSNKSKYSYLYLFFCLLDILEPVNAFNCVSPNDVHILLNSINYSAIKGSIVISANYTNQVENLAHRIFDIPIWLKVGLNIVSDKKIIITINGNI